MTTKELANAIRVVISEWSEGQCSDSDAVAWVRQRIREWQSAGNKARIKNAEKTEFPLYTEEELDIVKMLYGTKTSFLMLNDEEISELPPSLFAERECIPVLLAMARRALKYEQEVQRYRS